MGNFYLFFFPHCLHKENALYTGKGNRNPKENYESHVGGKEIGREHLLHSPHLALPAAWREFEDNFIFTLG